MEETIRNILRSGFDEDKKIEAIKELTRGKMSNLLMELSENEPEIFMKYSEDDDGGEGAYDETIDMYWDKI